MSLIRASIERPVAVVAAVLMVVLFGALALTQIPVQLAPDVNKPVISVTTAWFGAAPAEVEREIVNRQEDALKGLEGLEKMTSSSSVNEGEVTLEFSVDTNMDRALLLVANRLDRVSNYPAEASEPTLSTSGDGDNAMAWFILTRETAQPNPMAELGDFSEDVIKERIERVAGVARANIFGGTARELVIEVDPDRMAQFGVSLSQVVAAIRAANVSLSAGAVDEGKRRYTTRVDAQFNSPEVIGQTVLVQTPNGAQVRLADVAEIQFDFQEAGANIRYLGDEALAINAVRETGANVIETMAEIRAVVSELNAGPLAAAGLKLEQVYDETEYVEQSIDQVQQNIAVGGLLAAGILLLFLRSPGATLVVSVAIPVSVIGSFVAMAALGRSINVISLAGLAFAVGMVVDAAIVVLEKIVSNRQKGMSAPEAAYQGAAQIWGAILVSSLTTVMVFIPILTLKLEVGQLFRDIAVAISVAVSLSLIVAVTLIPAMSRKVMGGNKPFKPLRLPIIDPIGRAFARFILGMVRLFTANKLVSLLVAVGLAAGSLTVSSIMLPKLEYLPEGNRNLVFGFILPPPGYNLETTSAITRDLENASRGLWARDTGEVSEPGQPPKIDNFFVVALRQNAFVGATAVDEQRAGELIPALQGPIFAEPGTFGFMSQPSIFGRGVDGSRSISIDIRGPDLPTILGIAGQTAGRLAQAFPRSEGHQFRPIPGLELGAPEVRVQPRLDRLADAGVSPQELGLVVDAFNDGVRVDQITLGSDRLNLVLKGVSDSVDSTQQIGFLPVVTPGGGGLPVNALADVVLTAGPTQIRHLERTRAITLEFRPAPGTPLEAIVEQVREQVVAPMSENLPGDVSIGISGTADALNETWDAMVIQLLVALVIVYLVMAVLFESFVYPLVIVTTVPLAMAGAMIGLGLLNLSVYQPLDMLTMLGFVILIGIVVNNAILLVDQSLRELKVNGLEPREAIIAATQDRIRPIFMSTLTSIFGMLPLVLVTGAGSELYRGLGTVVVGGLSLSALLTLAIIPPLLFLVLRKPKPAPIDAVDGITSAGK